MFRMQKRGLRGHITVQNHVKGCYKEDWDQFSLVREDRIVRNRF